MQVIENSKVNLDLYSCNSVLNFLLKLQRNFFSKLKTGFLKQLKKYFTAHYSMERYRGERENCYV